MRSHLRNIVEYTAVLPTETAHAALLRHAAVYEAVGIHTALASLQALLKRLMYDCVQLDVLAAAVVR
jgi:hypothetical protein